LFFSNLLLSVPAVHPPDLQDSASVLVRLADKYSKQFQTSKPTKRASKPASQPASMQAGGQ
jgi:hypothetical protein